ncbi:M28 family metallopeptidase [Paludisphaera rhizosphaerae]|uniref:M28 family metallopeptidase n=1 Tax=Paludisphaera rhizosphaerae TaxID=2711216 RepID=UPI0013ED2C91|nr:M20/M25/M40 family metallo-hydrolase [Paludisphaera rhizosphaerae]
MHDASTRSQRFAPRVLSVARLVAVATVACLFRLGTVCAEEPGRIELERWVKLLASPELEGRRGEGGRKTAGAIADEFRRLGLKPLFDGQYIQEIPPAPPADMLGRNVGAILPGSDPKLAARYVILSAHYDHLGVRGGVLYPGADDNASGVAMMLESARCLAEAAEKPQRSVVFIAFDQEEAGLYGSRYFVAHPPFAVESVDLFVTADMIGRSLGGVCGDFFFVMGTEHVPALRPWLTEAVGGRPLRMGILGADLLVLNRSDYGPFRSKKVPFLFFSTGENPRYHSPSDTPETIDYPKMTEISRVIYGVVARAGMAPTLPAWSDQTDNPVEEAMTIREVLKSLDAHRDALRLNAAQGYVIDGALKTLEGVAARGAITASERSSLLRAARLVLMTAF